ncbi:hypothetical protein Pan153_34080 [Gimesia panareensis]|uniref:Uncharacterized protein n=1 Tax=Gimesia panareensis TaxID=2527978 RepID=A0A518FQW3_9PLAN|nr:hypothetical protein [Gimesia panareensis]QDV18747.1 hypothetical protein Pan153_34080 [Gimesia panareensis]
MSTTESVLHEVLEQRAIGAAKIGGSFSSMAQRYGDPTIMLTDLWREYGLDERCKIWFYDELQVWSDPYGTIDRIFFDIKNKQPECTNQNFVGDLADIRDKLKDCDFETFVRVLGDSRAETSRTYDSTKLSFMGDDIEIFATFRADGADGPHYLSMLRLNTIDNPKGSRE